MEFEYRWVTYTSLLAQWLASLLAVCLYFVQAEMLFGMDSFGIVFDKLPETYWLLHLMIRTICMLFMIYIYETKRYFVVIFVAIQFYFRFSTL